MRTMSIITIYQEYKDDQIFQGDLQGLAWEVDFWSSKCKTSGLHTRTPLWLVDCLQEERVSFMIISSIHHHHEQDKKIYGWDKDCNGDNLYGCDTDSNDDDNDGNDNDDDKPGHHH